MARGKGKKKKECFVKRRVCVWCCVVLGVSFLFFSDFVLVVAII